MIRFHGRDWSRDIGPVTKRVRSMENDRGKKNGEDYMDAYILTSPSSTAFGPIEEILLHAVTYVGTEFR